MKAHGRQVLATATLLAIVGFGCSGPEERKGDHQIWFMGSIYDGATGMVVNGYEIALTYGPTTIRGKVDANGRYTVGPLPAWNDYAIQISAPYYRPFVSYNSGIAPPTPPPASQASDVYNSRSSQTFNFDAYVFPDGVPVTPLTVNILKSDTAAAPAEGSIRLRPTTQSVIQDQAAGVTGQVWANDQDMLANVVSDVFTGGSLVIDATRLVYGVTYQVTVYGVEGYQPNTATVRAGLQENVIINITTTASPLLLVTSTQTQCKPYGQSTNVQATAQIVFTFNTSAIEDATTSLGKGPEVLDTGLTVATFNGATLKPNGSTTLQERGTSFLLNGNTLSIAWNPSVGIATQISGDTIQYVIYNNLASIMLQPTGHPELVKTLSTLIGASSITCAN
jgi:hypothetical protein